MSSFVPPSRLAERRGFSLMEMILASALVAILAILSLTAIGRARESARSAGCTQKLRQIGVALAAYIGEHNGMLIPYASLGGSPQRYWFDELDKYMGEEPYNFERSRPYEWQLCPSKPVVPERRDSIGYGWNHRYLGYTASDPKGGPASIHQITRHSETIVIGDSHDIDRADPPAGSSENRYLYSHLLSRLAKRHSGKGFYLMLDGHVMAATPEEVLDGGTGPYRLYWRKTR